MIRLFTKQLLLVFACAVLFGFGAMAQTNISGSVKDGKSNESLLGVSILVKDKVVGTISDTNGNFKLKVNSEPPLTLVFSMVGYTTVEVAINENNVEGLTVSLEETAIMGQEVVVSASRVEESVMQSPVSIEKMDVLTIKETAATNFYDALINFKGVDMSAQSITFKSINTRGFGANGNNRFVQLIDGIDNVAPGLNFAVGNIVGINDLDLESAEMIPGAASALYGPNALNGVLLMKSKSPFDYQGLSAYTKLGVNHVDGEDDDPSLYQDYGIRYAKAFNNKFAVKVTASYLKANDFRGVDYRDQSTTTNGEGSGYVVESEGRNRQNNRNYDGVNTYGDFGFNLGLIPKLDPAYQAVAGQLPTGPDGAFSPTGYTESSFVDNNTESLKLGAALHYRITDNLEVSGQFNYGSGSTVYTANDRFVLDGFSIWTAKLELRNQNFYVRAYTTQENSGDTYAANTIASLINQNKYVPDYTLGFLGARGQGASIDQAHAAARQYADGLQTAYAPGTEQWQVGMDSLRKISIFDGGAKFKDASSMNHFEGSYNFSHLVDFVEIVAGANYRKYNLDSGGTLFALDDDGEEQSYGEYGAYVQLSKAFLNNRLKVQASGRYDKNENFDGQFSPRVSVVGTVARNHNFRGSFQRGFRIPTTQDQFIDLDVQTRRLIGSNSLLVDRYKFRTNTVYTTQSLADARAGIRTDLVRADKVDEDFTTEKISTFEVGYRGLFLQDKLMIDGYYYHSSYQDFIAEIYFVQAVPNGLQNDPGYDPDTQAAQDAIIQGTVPTQEYGFDVNADGSIKTHGWGLQADYFLTKGYKVSGNVAFNRLLDDQALQDQGFRSQYNTPEYTYNIGLSNREVIENVGFNVKWRWQEAFLWSSSFGNSVVPAFGTLDAQVSYKLSSLKSVVKLGGSNVLNKRYTTGIGNPRMGAIYYVSITFDQFLN
ncbi:carboxypeptidase-like regulatory domain-containing protein [Reichenbachiella agarivorans]|uniref:Carboxypeptidase-like regulatory domain-containing protein n=1 Tax=Reichenbachiella agarivorans TaxID=2979464 RepID=A0ABY6CTK2_9BACT|nr:TonB-dependent receptor [Reichenbachiella agarivorans]UXP33851.1 carboxypeptidase-like regulatory domain-containing protein [Reichenbachiella agarivorans]